MTCKRQKYMSFFCSAGADSNAVGYSRPDQGGGYDGERIIHPNDLPLSGGGRPADSFCDPIYQQSDSASAAVKRSEGLLKSTTNKRKTFSLLHFCLECPLLCDVQPFWHRHLHLDRPSQLFCGSCVAVRGRCI